MTLIAQSHSNREAFFAVADTLITTNQAIDASAEMLPLQVGLQTDFGTHAVRCASKAVLFGDYVVLWAGVVKSAQELIAQFKSLQKPTHEDFMRVIDQNPRINKDVCLIYACANGKVSWSGSWRCEERVFEGTELIAAGTGAGDFLNFNQNGADFDISTKEGVWSVGSVATTRLGALVRSELVDYLHKYSDFGGAYEIIIAKENGGFQRANYSISEISNRLHLDNRWDTEIGVSRTIQCMGRQDGSDFLVHIYGKDVKPRLAFFDLYDITTEGERPKTATEDDFVVTFSFAYVIGSRFSWHSRTGQYFSHMTFDNDSGLVGINYNQKEIEEVTKDYFQSGGGLIQPDDAKQFWSKNV